MINTKEAFSKGLKEYLNLETYDSIMKTYRTVDLSDPLESELFRRMFNGYYNIRRDKDWQDVYYRLFEEAKRTENLTFADILYNLYKETGQIEKSFSSKMLATINPDKPILDSRVISYLNKHDACIGFSGRIIDSSFTKYGEDVTEKDIARLEPVIREYEDLELWYEEYLGSFEAGSVVNAFNEEFPQYSHFTNTRKVDYFLWMLG